MDNIVTFKITQYTDKTYRVESTHISYHFRDELLQECKAEELFEVLEKITYIMKNKYQKYARFIVV